MSAPAGWQNPIGVPAGYIQRDVQASALLPARADLVRIRLDFQRSLLRSGQKRLTPIQVTQQGVIYDGHHAVRAAADDGIYVDVLVVDETVPPSGLSILDLPVR